MSTSTRLLIGGLAALVMVVGCSEKSKDQALEGAERAAETTKSATSNVAMTGKITMALQNANSLKMENMDVDTVDKTITLRGYVKTDDMRQTAERIAKDTAGPEYTINNEIALSKG